MNRPLIRFLFIALASALVLLVAKPALAQSITVINETSLPRIAKDGSSITKRPLALTPEAVNLQDCIDDQQIAFPIQMSGFVVNSSVQVWASTAGDCKLETSRSSLQKVCWRVLDTDVPLVTATTVNIPVRRIMSGAPPLGAPGAEDPARISEAVCGKVNLVTINVQFLYFNPSEPSTAAFAKNVAVSVDTIGPDPPSGLSTLPGNTRIQVKWANISGGSVADGSTATGGLTELTGVKVYCAAAGTKTEVTPNPPVCRNVPVEAGVSDAALDADADATVAEEETVEVCEDGGVSETTTNECTVGAFADDAGSAATDEAGTLYPTAKFNGLYQCGEIIGNTGTTVNATTVNGAPLINGQRYAVAVAATDKLGNVGKLSPVECQTPDLTTDFWDDYKNAGGQAGGCATTSESTGLPIGGLAILGLIGMSVVRSRTKKKTTKKQQQQTTTGDRDR